MLGTGLLVYLLSKEIYIINHETISAASIGMVIIYAIKKFGPSVAAFADKLNEVGWTISACLWINNIFLDVPGQHQKHVLVVANHNFAILKCLK